MSQRLLKTKTETIPPGITSIASAIDGAAPNSLIAYARLIEAVSTNPELDVHKLDRLLQMQQEVLEREAKLAFDAALLKVQSQVPTIVCDKVNTHTGSRYVSLEKLQLVLKPILLANGFTATFAEGDPPVDGRLHLVGTVRHVGGHTEVFNRYATPDTTGPNGTRNKTDVQGSQSSMSFLERRLRCSVFGVTVAEEDKDGNAATGTACINPKQLAALQKLIGEVKQDVGKFFTYYGIKTLAELPLTSYDDAVQGLEFKLAKRREREVA